MRRFPRTLARNAEGSGASLAVALLARIFRPILLDELAKEGDNNVAVRPMRVLSVKRIAATAVACRGRGGGERGSARY
jgi:hypothetical protein